MYVKCKGLKPYDWKVAIKLLSENVKWSMSSPIPYPFTYNNNYIFHIISSGLWYHIGYLWCNNRMGRYINKSLKEFDGLSCDAVSRGLHLSSKKKKKKTLYGLLFVITQQMILRNVIITKHKETKTF